MIRRPPRSTLDRSSAASDVYKRQTLNCAGSGPNAKTWTQFAPVSNKEVTTQDLQEHSRRDLAAAFCYQITAPVVTLNVYSIARMDPVLIGHTQRLEPIVSEVQHRSTRLVFV